MHSDARVYDEEVFSCVLSELNIIFHNKFNEVIEFDLRNKANEFVLYNLLPANAANINYVTCMSEMDCYVLKSYPSNNCNLSHDILVNNSVLVTNDVSKSHFGHALASSLTLNACESVTIC